MENSKTVQIDDEKAHLERSQKRLISNSTNQVAQVGSYCPNCGARLEGQKCKLFCRTPGCGYLVTCSEW